MNSEKKSLLFNGRLTIVSADLVSGTYPNRKWFVSNSIFTDNLDGRSITDAAVGDMIIDSSKNRFQFAGFTGATGAGLFYVQELPWADQINESVAPYTRPQTGHSFIFRKLPKLNLFQHGREALGITQELVDYMAQKGVYQFEENIPLNILGSNSDLAPTDGQTGGISNDRPLPVNGDLWINPTTAEKFVYNGSQWRKTPDVTGPQGARGFQGFQGSNGGGTTLSGYITQVSDETTSSTSSAAFQTKLTMTTPSLVAGTYRLGYEFEMAGNLSTGTSYCDVEVVFDSVVVANALNALGGATRFDLRSGFNYRTLTAGVKTALIRYKISTTNGSGTVYLRKCRLELWRIS